MPEVAVQLDGVSREFQSGSSQLTAVDDVTLRIGMTEAVAIIGPSGSGKSTLLHLIAGLDRPTSGSVITIGQRLNDMSESQLTRFRARNLGFVFQDSHLLPGLTALENVMVARLPHDRRRELERNARQLLTAVGLGARLDHSPAKLSGGERQRVGIARALIGQPKLLVADEPTGNLDAGSTEEILSLLNELRVDSGLTFLVATHDPAVAASANRIIRLVAGHVQQDSILAAETRVQTWPVDA